MSVPLPTESYVATVVAGKYTITANPSRITRLCTGISLTGPAGSSVQLFLNSLPFDNTPRGDINTADYGTGKVIPKGGILKLVWSVGTGTPVPSCAIYTERMT
jgi:hypothetical protein